MYVVTREGHKLPVDTSTLAEDDYLSFQQSVGLYDDSTILKEIWILELYKSNWFESGGRKDRYELTFVKELRYEHEPTKEDDKFLSSWSVLDIGTGNGVLLQELAKQGYAY